MVPTRLRFNHDELDSVRIDMLFLCSLVNWSTETGTYVINLRSFAEINVSLWYRLLTARPLDEILEAGVDDFAVQHAGTLLFMMTTFLDNERRQIVDYAPVRQCVMHVVQGLHDEVDCISKIWFLLLGMVWFSGTTTSARIKDSLRAAAVGLGSRSWSEVRAAMTELPWIDILHENAARTIWEQLCEKP